MEPAKRLEELKDLICRVVTEKQGIKATALAAVKDFLPYHKEFDIPAVTDQLIEEKRLLEIEYILPRMSYRIKSFLLPAGTAARFRGKLNDTERFS